MVKKRKNKNKKKREHLVALQCSKAMTNNNTFAKIGCYEFSLGVPFNKAVVVLENMIKPVEK